MIAGFVCGFFLFFLSYLQHSQWPAKDAGPKPLDLAYVCSKVKEGQEYEKPPILMIHGIFNAKETFSNIYQTLSDKTGRKTCIADLRNHGDSPWSNESDVAALAADFPRLMDTLRAPRVVLYGHSLGGKVAIHVTLNHPERIEKLLVEDNKPNGASPEAVKYELDFTADFLNSLSAIPAGATDEEAKTAVVQYFIDIEKLNVTKSAFRMTVASLPLVCSDGKCRWKANVNVIAKEQLDPNFLTVSSGRYDGPTLFMYGTESPLKVKEDESNIMRLFPNARLVPFYGAGHQLHILPGFVDVVADFINESG